MELREVTDAVLAGAAHASGWSRGEAPHENHVGELVCSWIGPDGESILSDTLEPGALPYPRSHAQRAALVSFMSGQCPVCGAVAGVVEGDDPGVSQRVASYRPEFGVDSTGGSAARLGVETELYWIVHDRACPVAPWSLDALEDAES